MNVSQCSDMTVKVCRKKTSFGKLSKKTHCPSNYCSVTLVFLLRVEEKKIKMQEKHTDFENATDLIRLSPHSSSVRAPTALEALTWASSSLFLSFCAGSPNLDTLTRWGLLKCWAEAENLFHWFMIYRLRFVDMAGVGGFTTVDLCLGCYPPRCRITVRKTL